MIKKLYKPGLIIIGLVALYSVLGFIAIPALLTAKLPELLSQTLEAPANVSKITINPFKGQFTITGFDLKDQQKQPFLAFSEFYIDVDALESLKTQSLVLKEARIEKPVVHITALKKGGFNFSSFQSSDETGQTSQGNGLFPLQIRQVQLNDGQLLWRDLSLSHPVTETFKAIDLAMHDFSLRENRPAHLKITAQLDAGGKLDWQTDLSVQPFSANGRIKLEKLSANRLWALFLKDSVNFKMPQGDADIGLAYAIAYQKSLRLNVKEGLLTARKIQFTALDNARPLISVPEFGIKGLQFDLAAQKLKIAALDAKGVDLKTGLNAQGQFNYQTLFASKPAQQKPAPKPPKGTPVIPEKPWQVTIDSTSIQQLQAEFSDQTNGLLGDAKLAGFAIHLSGLLMDYTPQQLQMRIQKGGFGWRKLTLRELAGQQTVRPLHCSLGEFQFNLGKYTLNYSAPDLAMTAQDGSLAAHDLNLHEGGAKQALISIAGVSMQGAQLDLAKQRLKIKRIQSEKGRFSASLDKQGRLNYQQLFKPEPVTASTAVKTASVSESWHIILDELQLKNYHLTFQDSAQKEPVNLELAPLNLKLQDLTLEKGRKLPFTLQAKINRTAALDLKGHLVLEPFSSELQLNLQNLGLKNFQEYLNGYVRADVIDGALDSALKIKLSQPVSSDLQVNVQGNSAINDFLLRDHILNKDLIKWRALKLDSIDFDLAPFNLDIARVLLQNPYGRITIKKDHSLNFDDIIIKQKPKAIPAKSGTASKPVSKPVKPRYKIGALTVAGGSSDFSDFSLILPFVVQLNDLNGTIKSISSETKKLTDFNLTGKVFDLSPMDVKGNFNADFSALDIGMHFKGMPLPFISPYMVEFAGYKIKKGKISVDLLYKITGRKVTAENNFVLDQLTLGEKVDNPKATSLPLKLAIALLKDANGRIKINMPISGSLDDPDFSIAPLLWDAFVNMLTRVVSSPFNALGSLLSSDENYSEIGFDEGSEQLRSAGNSKLDDLAKALTQKPALSIEIKGSAYEKQDWPAMQEDALLDQLKAIKAEELKRQGKRQLAEYVELSEGDYQRLLANLFISKFPQLGKRSFFGTPELINSKADFYEVAKQQLAAIIPPNQLKLRDLASARARNIAQYLIQKGNIPHERVYILDADLQKQAANDAVTCELALRTE